MRFDISYRATFHYPDMVRESQNELRACPISDDNQQLISHRVHTEPRARVIGFSDYWGTHIDAFGVSGAHRHLEVFAEASVETFPRPLVTIAPSLDALAAPDFLEEHVEYLERSPHCDWGDGVAAAGTRVGALAGSDVVSHVLVIHRSVGAALRYTPGATKVGEDIEDVLSGGHGVCQDYAHLAVALCRTVGVPARYVSGYLFTVDDSSGAEGTEDIVNVQTHAWFEAAIPGFGWLALDPTNQQAVGVRHVKIGHGRDYDDVPPLRGVYNGSGKPELDVTVEIRRSAVSGSTPPTTPNRHLLHAAGGHGAHLPVPTGTRRIDDVALQQQAQQQ